MSNNDCLYLDRKSRLCTIYEKRPDTCRNHPKIGPRPGYCAYKPKEVARETQFADDRAVLIISRFWRG